MGNTLYWCTIGYFNRNIIALISKSIVKYIRKAASLLNNIFFSDISIGRQKSVNTKKRVIFEIRIKVLCILMVY